MREIKFRGLGIDGKWWFGESSPVGENYVNLATFFANLHAGAIRPETIGEYTGRKDKNDKEIYEGDLIKGLRDVDSDYSTQIAQVEFREGAFVESYFGEPIRKYTSSYHYGNTLEVLGNIYEDPKTMVLSSLKQLANTQGEKTRAALPLSLLIFLLGTKEAA